MPFYMPECAAQDMRQPSKIGVGGVVCPRRVRHGGPLVDRGRVDVSKRQWDKLSVPPSPTALAEQSSSVSVVPRLLLLFHGRVLRATVVLRLFFYASPVRR